MATIQQLEEGIRLADQAGDIEAVQVLGSELLRMRQAQSAPAPVNAAPEAPVEDPNRLQAPMGNVVPGMETIPMPRIEEAAPLVRGAAPALANMAAGAGIGFMAGGPVGAAAGASIAGLATMVADPLVAGVNALFGTRIKTPTEAWGHIMDYAGIPESSTEGQKLIEAIARGGASAMSGIGAGRILQQAANPIAKNIGGLLASGPAQQVVGGALGGGTGELARYGAEQVGLGDTGQAIAGFVGSLPGAMVGSNLATPRTIGAPSFNVPGMTPAAVEETLRNADAAGRAVFSSDVFRPKTWLGRRLQDVSEGAMTMGTAAKREAQQATRMEAIQDVLSQFGAAADLDLAQEIAQNVNALKSQRIAYWSDMKNTLLDRISGGVPNLKSPELSRTFTTLAEQIDALNQINPEIYKPTIEKLMGFGKGLLGPEVLDSAGNVVGRAGISLKAAEENLKAVRKFLANDPTLANVKTPLENIGNSLYGALKEDIKSVINKAEGASAVGQYERANAKLYEGIKELESDSLRAIFRKGNIKPEVVYQALYSAKPSEQRLLYANLDGAGKAAVRGAILSKAASESLDKDGVISTAKFATQLHKNRKQIGLFFNPAQKEEIDGLANYLRVTRRAEDYNTDPKTGARMFMPAVVGGIFTKFGAPAAVAGATLFQAMAHGFESKTARRLLTQLSKVKRNSDEEYALAKRLTEVFNASVSNSAAEAVRDKQLTFLQPNVKAEQMEIGGVLTDQETGYRIVSKDRKNFTLYGPDNQRIGIYASQESARKKAEKEFRKRK